MKRLMTAIAICGLLLSAASAYADDEPDPRVWDGGYGGNSYWSAVANWDWEDAEPSEGVGITITDDSAGTLSIHDSGMTASSFGALTLGNGMDLRSSKSGLSFSSASFTGNAKLSGTQTTSLGTMTVDASSVTLDINGNGARSASTLTLDADSANEARTLTLTHTGAGTPSLTVATSTTVIADDDTGNYPATFTLSAGTFDPAALYLLGGDTVNRQAIFDYDAGTIIAPDSMTMESYVEIDAEAGFCVAGDFTVQANGSPADASVDVNGATISVVGTFEVKGDASNSAQLTVTGGTIQTVNACP